MEVGQLQLNYAPTDLHDLIKKVADPLRISTEKNGVKLSITLDENVPQLIQSDELRLKQILTNILGNAGTLQNENNI